MSRVDKIRKWLRRSFPGLYRRFGRYFHTHYRLQQQVLRHFRRHPELYAEPELAAAVERLRRGGISVFSFPGCERYEGLAVEVRVDEDGFPWVDHGGKRLYFKRGTAAERVAGYYRRLRMEQDGASPHRYLVPGFESREGDVLLDIGAAEGIWALEGVEKASRVVLFEVDEAWIGALERTFAPWKDKITIVAAFASDEDSEGNVRVDTVLGGPGPEGIGTDAPLLLKMDVEGAEERVLAGAVEALALPGTRAVVCTYHRADDHRRLSETMRGRGFEVDTSPGWMLFLHDGRIAPPFFRHGVIYCKKP